MSLDPHAASLPTREKRAPRETCGMLPIRARKQAGAAVNKTGAWSWGKKVMAPRHGFEPRFTAPKAAVLPLDDRGISRNAFSSVPSACRLRNARLIARAARVR